jgi:hypothetical protein
VKKGDRVVLKCGGNTAFGEVFLLSDNKESLAIKLNDDGFRTDQGLFLGGLALTLLDGQYRELRTGAVIEIAVT